MHAYATRLIILAIALTCTCRAHAEAMRAFNTQHYRIVTDTDDRTAAEIAAYMDGVFSEYAARLSTFPAKRKDASTLYLFEQEQAYTEFLSRVGFDARNTAGVFFSKNGETGLATFVTGQQRDRMLDTLRHEGFHQFAHSRLGRALPIWVNEGLAEYFGNGVMVEGSLRVGFAPAAPLERVRMAVANEFQYSFDEMLRMTPLAWHTIVNDGGPNAGLLYDQAWLMTHFLVHADGGRYAKAFERYLALVAGDTPSVDAFAKAFGSDDTTVFERAWINWLAAAEPDPISTAGERASFLMQGIRLLDQQGVTIESISELKRELRRRHFEVFTTSHSIERVISSFDDEVFTVPSPRASFEIVPPVVRGGLATVRVSGLELDVSGHWRTNPDGEHEPEIVYR